MPLAPWRSTLADALHANRALPYARYLQLATVRPNGRPANRTIVFRGFWDNTNQLQFAVDRRSEKIEQIANQPWGEICWYFPNTREQLRLAGELNLITADAAATFGKARQRLWQSLSDSARVQFAWSDPGKPRAAEDAFSPPPPDAIEPLENFCLLLLEPVEVDHLELRGEPQNRTHYRQDNGEWSVQSVNP